jgi:predicted TIM-barrel fold metal-dependent hydrolase
VDRLADLPLRAFRPRSQLRTPAREVPRPLVPAIDAHNHLGRWLTHDWSAPDVDALLATMDACGVRAIVNLDGRPGELEANLERYDRAHPGRFATFCQLDWTEATRGGDVGARLAEQLRTAVAAGAHGLKVWKDLGLHVRDETEALVMPDDPRLSDLWEAAADLAVPVLIHTADPVAFFEALDETNERLEELLENPDWWFGDRDRFPAFDTLMGSLEALVAAHPGTTFIGAHAGCCAEDLGWLDAMLTTHPNFNADIAARIAELGRQPRAARAIITRHADRFLFGTDAFPPDAGVYARHFRFLETADEHFPYDADGDVPTQGRWAIDGLDLAPEVLAAVYAGNAARLIPALAP